jgi:hypothetical protein
MRAGARDATGPAGRPRGERNTQGNGESRTSITWLRSMRARSVRLVSPRRASALGLACGRRRRDETRRDPPSRLDAYAKAKPEPPRSRTDQQQHDTRRSLAARPVTRPGTASLRSAPFGLRAAAGLRSRLSESASADRRAGSSCPCAARLTPRPSRRGRGGLRWLERHLGEVHGEQRRPAASARAGVACAAAHARLVIPAALALGAIRRREGDGQL